MPTHAGGLNIKLRLMETLSLAVGFCADTSVTHCKYVRVSSTMASLPSTVTVASTRDVKIKSTNKDKSEVFFRRRGKCDMTHFA